MLNKIKEKMTELNVHMDQAKDNLENYIMFRARKVLDGKAGAVEDEVVYGWARHYYEEPQSVIDEEMKPIKVEKPKPQNNLVQEYKKDHPKPEKPKGGQLSLEL